MSSNMSIKWWQNLQLVNNKQFYLDPPSFNFKWAKVTRLNLLVLDLAGCWHKSRLTHPSSKSFFCWIEIFLLGPNSTRNGWHREWLTPVEGFQILVTLGQVLAMRRPTCPCYNFSLDGPGRSRGWCQVARQGRQAGLDRLGRELGLAWIDQVAKEAPRLARNISGWPDYFPSPA